MPSTKSESNRIDWRLRFLPEVSLGIHKGKGCLPNYGKEVPRIEHCATLRAPPQHVILNRGFGQCSPEKQNVAASSVKLSKRKGGNE
jgi:hypothetical protein